MLVTKTLWLPLTSIVCKKKYKTKQKKQTFLKISIPLMKKRGSYGFGFLETLNVQIS